MATLTQQEFVDLLLKAASMSLELAQEQIVDPLPQQICWKLIGFEHAGKISSLNEIVGILYRDGRFPVIVDVTVAGILDNCTIIRLRPSGHAFVDSVESTWNVPAGMGPFKPLGLMLPHAIWHRPRPLSLGDLREAATGWPKT